MRLFVFAIGGTGSRVLESLVMLLASGYKLNNPLLTEIVPIIVDPDVQNGNLGHTEQLLRSYRNVQQKITRSSRDSHFFKTPITSIAKLADRSTDGFLFNLGSSDQLFQDFIGYNALDSEDQKFMGTLFSNRNLQSDMRVGFKGNPNMGSIVLNQIKHTSEFSTFLNIFQPGDRIFIVSSIFGGTGAAGFPLLLKTLRGLDAAAPKANALKQAVTGAVSLLPYFTLKNDPKNGQKVEIQSSSFVSKTKAALSYYEKHLHGLDMLYYLGDRTESEPYEYSVGGRDQKTPAHLLELIAATSVLHFAGTPDNIILQGRGATPNPTCLEFGIAKDEINLTLPDLGPVYADMLGKPLTHFRYLTHLILNHHDQSPNDLPWKQDIGFGPQNLGLDATYNTDLKHIAQSFSNWLQDLAKNRRSFAPFNLSERRMSAFIANKTVEAGFMQDEFDEHYFDKLLNSFSQSREGRALISNTPEGIGKFLLLSNHIIEKAFNERVKTFK